MAFGPAILEVDCSISMQKTLRNTASSALIR